MRSWKGVFQLKSKKNYPSTAHARDNFTNTAVLDSKEVDVIDKNKRSFLKLIGIAGAGAVVASLIPKQAEAAGMPMNVVVTQNSAGQTINPAIEATAISIQTATEATKTATDTVNTNTGTLVTNSNLFTFTGSDLQVISGDDPNTARVRDDQEVVQSALRDDSVVFLRRIVKLMESKATVDSANRKRTSWDAWAENISGPLDTGTASGTLGAQSPATLVDSTKYSLWTENKWSYYAVKITSGTGSGQIRMIAANTSTTLTLQSPWNIQPDGTSAYGIYEVSSSILEFGTVIEGSGLSLVQDAAKSWSPGVWANYAIKIQDTTGTAQIRLISGNDQSSLFFQNPYAAWTALLGASTTLDFGIATGTQSSTTVGDTSKSWSVNAWTNYLVKITGGTGVNQTRTIASNTSTVVTVSVAWTTTPDTTSTYAIYTFLASGTATGSQSDTTLGDTTKSWTQNMWPGYLVKITGGTGIGQVRSIVSNTTTALTVSFVWTVTPDTTSTYTIYTTYNPAWTAQLTAAAANLESGIATGTQSATTVGDTTKVWVINKWAGYLVKITGGTGIGQIGTINSNTATALTVNIAWTTTPDTTSTYTIYTIYSPSGTTQLGTVASLVTGTATGIQSTTTLVDTSKVWTNNAWTNYLVKIVSGTGSGQIRPIISNTDVVLTVQYAWATTPDATSTYAIYVAYNPLWTTPLAATPILESGRLADALTIISSTATAGSTTTLTDSTKAWSVNQWVNYMLKITSGTGVGQTQPITSNTATVLTVTYAWITTPDTTSVYAIATADAQMAGSLMDSSKAWSTDAYVGYVVAIKGGTGTDQAQIVASNTSNTLTLEYPWLVTPDATSSYVLYSLPSDAAETGTASGAWTSGGLPDLTTLEDTTKTWGINVWQNYLVIITSGTGAGQVRQIFTNTATYIQIYDAWVIQPDHTSTYAIYVMPQRNYQICTIPTLFTDVGGSAGMVRVGIGTDSTVGTIASLSSVTTIGSYFAQQKFGDISHKVYNDSIRSRLTFT